jgi:hypothetical protein
MAELRKTKRSLFVRNNTPFLWTLHEGAGASRVDIELKPSGQRGSICFLPPQGLDAPGISRNLSSSKITVSPDLEDEMIELDRTGAEGAKKVLEQFQVELQQSPHARAINVKDSVQDRLDQAIRKRSVTPQARQSVTGSMVDEFINPSPIKAEDGTVRNAMTGEVITPSAEVADENLVSNMLGKVALTQSRSVEEN